MPPVFAPSFGAVFEPPRDSGGNTPGASCGRCPKRADLPAPQQWVDVVLQRVLVAADGLGLVRLAAAIEDRSGSHPSHKRDAGLADGRRRRRTQPPRLTATTASSSHATAWARLVDQGAEPCARGHHGLRRGSARRSCSASRVRSRSPLRDAPRCSLPALNDVCPDARCLSPAVQRDRRPLRDPRGRHVGASYTPTASCQPGLRTRSRPSRRPPAGARRPGRAACGPGAQRGGTGEHRRRLAA